MVMIRDNTAKLESNPNSATYQSCDLRQVALSLSFPHCKTEIPQRYFEDLMNRCELLRWCLAESKDYASSITIIMPIGI